MAEDAGYVIVKRAVTSDLAQRAADLMVDELRVPRPQAKFTEYHAHGIIDEIREELVKVGTFHFSVFLY
jgi:hypothetical protein